MTASVLAPAVILALVLCEVAAAAGTLVAPPRAHTFGVRRVTSREVALFVPGSKLENPGGIAVTRLRASDQPGAQDDDEVTIVAVDQAGWVFSNFGLLQVGTFRGEQTSLGPLRKPTDVAIDRDGRVVVTDTGNRRLVLLRHPGDELVPVAGIGGFLEPVAVAADGDGGFLVCDRRFNAVFRVDFETGEKSTFGLEVAFDRPVAIAAVPSGDPMARGQAPHVVIVDQDGARIRSFNRDGALRAAQSLTATGDPNARLDAVDLDYYGNVLGVDSAANRVHKFRHDLYHLASFGERGRNEGEFLGPRGIAIHRRLGQVFVTEEDGGQYLWVGTDVRDLAVDAKQRSVAISYVLTEASLVTARILDQEGREIVALVAGDRQGAGPQTGQWDGTTPGGRTAPAGQYFVELTVRATYASKSTWKREVRRAFVLGAP